MQFVPRVYTESHHSNLASCHQAVTASESQGLLVSCCDELVVNQLPASKDVSMEAEKSPLLGTIS
jgi:hypothetical protein